MRPGITLNSGVDVVDCYLSIEGCGLAKCAVQNVQCWYLSWQHEYHYRLTISKLPPTNIKDISGGLQSI